MFLFFKINFYDFFKHCLIHFNLLPLSIVIFIYAFGLQNSLGMFSSLFFRYCMCFHLCLIFSLIFHGLSQIPLLCQAIHFFQPLFFLLFELQEIPVPTPAPSSTGSRGGTAEFFLTDSEGFTGAWVAALLTDSGLLVHLTFLRCRGGHCPSHILLTNKSKR